MFVAKLWHQSYQFSKNFAKFHANVHFYLIIHYISYQEITVKVFTATIVDVRTHFVLITKFRLQNTQHNYKSLRVINAHKKIVFLYCFDQPCIVTTNDIGMHIKFSSVATRILCFKMSIKERPPIDGNVFKCFMRSYIRNIDFTHNKKYTKFSVDTKRIQHKWRCTGNNYFLLTVLNVFVWCSKWTINVNSKTTAILTLE